jgi:malate dehydrogenase (oxaloacetate-decarboxylating)(NADP+)
MTAMITKEEALAYHSHGRKGKIEVISTKPCKTQKDLSLAYTPGVAQACKEIERDPDLSYEYTARGNLVAVITDGTAVLGLGNIGPLAGKPVMEGKGILFKRFADIDVFDLELNTSNVDDFIKIVRSMEPTFGGINLEDIKAPECFVIEETLKREMKIPVFHDDQHGTAIISGAALLNAAEVQGKHLADMTVVFSGAGAAAISCARHYVRLGVQRGRILLVDSKGVVHEGRTHGMNEHKRFFAAPTKKRTLAEALEGADVFAGLSAAGLVSPEMVKSMAAKPVIFAMANPDPEIGYNEAKSARPDAIMATGRSDFPNQVNNVLGFPFIFRGALDVRAKTINEEMKVAATLALARLAHEPGVPKNVLEAYNVKTLEFGPEYIIPKPLDPRVLVEESFAVAKAAMDSGVAAVPLEDLDAYRRRLEELARAIRDRS